MIYHPNYKFQVCYRRSRAKFWECFSYTFIETAMKEFHDKINDGFEFVSVVRIENQEIIACYSKTDFEEFKNTIEDELRG